MKMSRIAKSARRRWCRFVRKLGGGNEMVSRDCGKEGVGGVVASADGGTAAMGVRAVAHGGKSQVRHDSFRRINRCNMSVRPD